MPGGLLLWSVALTVHIIGSSAFSSPICPRTTRPLGSLCNLNMVASKDKVLLWDVMSTLVYDPFFVDVPKFFGVTLKEIYETKDPTIWLSLNFPAPPPQRRIGATVPFLMNGTNLL